MKKKPIKKFSKTVLTTSTTMATDGAVHFDIYDVTSTILPSNRCAGCIVEYLDEVKKSNKKTSSMAKVAKAVKRMDKDKLLDVLGDF